MSTNWRDTRDTVAIHDTTSFCDIGIDIPGVELYSDRALLLPAQASVVFDSPMLDPYLDWLRSDAVRLGPKRVIRVKGGRSLFASIDASPDALREIEALIQKGFRLQVFNRTDEIDGFLARHGIRDDQVHAPDPEIARKLANKAHLRRMASGLNASEHFAEHVITKDPRQVQREVRRLLERTESAVPFVVLQRTDLAGGYGTVFVERGAAVDSKVELFLREFRTNRTIVESWRQGAVKPFWTQEVEDPNALALNIDLEFLNPDVEYIVVRRPVMFSGLGRERVLRGENVERAVANFRRSWCENEIIVSVGYPHVAYSSQFIMGGSHPHFLGITQQIMDGTHHVGNAVTRSRHPRLDRETYETIKSHSMQWVEHLNRLAIGFVGTIGFDFIVVTKEGPRDAVDKVFMTECNPRQTASTYPLAVSAQVGERIHNPAINWGVVMLNAVPTAAKSFAELRERLGPSLMFEVHRGVIPFNIRQMELSDPSCGLIAVADTLEQAEAMIEEAKLRMIT